MTDTYRYTAYGELYNQSGTTTNNYRYTGQQYDALTGLYNLRARYYDPSSGRFLTRDTWPLDRFNPVELNRYQYGMSNPTTFSDPSGNFAFLSYGNFSLQSLALGAAINGIFSGTFSFVIQRIFLPEEDFSWEQVWKDAFEGALFAVVGAGISGYFTHMLKGWKALSAAWAAETAVETVYDTFTSEKSFFEALLWNSVTNLAAEAAGGTIEGAFKWWKNNRNPNELIDLIKRTSDHSARDATDTAVTTAKRSSETPGIQFGRGSGGGGGEDNTNRRNNDDEQRKKNKHFFYFRAVGPYPEPFQG